MATDSIVSNAQAAFAKALEYMHNEFAGLRVGRAHPGLVENLQVEQYGAMTILKNIASISVPEATQILISPWDKSGCADIEKAIVNSPLGLSCVNDGDTVRVTLPLMTEEKRHEIAKLAHGIGEDTKVHIRQAREDGRKAIDKAKDDDGLSEDMVKQLQDQLQDAVTEANNEVEKSAKEKEAEIMSV